MDFNTLLNKLSEVYKAESKNDLLYTLAITLNEYKNTKATFPNEKKHINNYLNIMFKKTPIIKNEIKNKIDNYSFEEINKEMGSDSTLYISNIKGINVICKSTNVYNSKTKDTAIYETLVYEFFINYLVLNKITPNLPFFYGNHIRIYYNEYYDLYSEYIEGIQLYKYLKDVIYNKSKVIKTNIKFWKSLLFQIIYTLACFEVFGIKHNDLHINNIILIDKLTGKIGYKYKENKYEVNIKDSGLVKIIDMDRSSVDCDIIKPNKTEKLYEDFIGEYNNVLYYYIKDNKDIKETECPNTYIHKNKINFKSIGITTTGTSYHDLFISICYILLMETNDLYLLDDETLTFVSNIFDIDIYDDDNDNHFDKAINLKKHICHSKSINDTNKSVLNILNHSYFNSLKVNDITTEYTFSIP